MIFNLPDDPISFLIVYPFVKESSRKGNMNGKKVTTCKNTSSLCLFMYIEVRHVRCLALVSKET